MSAMSALRTWIDHSRVVRTLIGASNGRVPSDCTDRSHWDRAFSSWRLAIVLITAWSWWEAIFCSAIRRCLRIRASLESVARPRLRDFHKSDRWRDFAFGALAGLAGARIRAGVFVIRRAWQSLLIQGLSRMVGASGRCRNGCPARGDRQVQAALPWVISPSASRRAVFFSPSISFKFRPQEVLVSGKGV